MEAILSEKEFIMREIHHRIRNNLQLISSFLSLEATLFPAKNIHEIILSCQSRIRSLSLIHENLNPTECSEYVNIKNYLDSLVNNLNQSPNSQKRIIQFDFESCHFKSEQLFPLGLLVNELISIEPHDSSDFKIQLTGRMVSSQYELIYNSSNVNQRFNLGKESLTMKLIHGFARQLNSKISIEFTNEIIIKNSIPIPETNKINYI